MKINSYLGDYEVNIGPINDFLKQFVSLEYKLFVIDENVWRNHSDGVLKYIPCSEAITFVSTEERKTLEGVQEIYDYLLRREAKRNLTLIAIGGGILQDISGFVASTLYRGINWIYAPTTLLSQADSCIGSKTSINYRGFKNILGSFYPPKSVCIDPSFLLSLSDEYYFSGLGEIVKLHIMGGEQTTIEYLNLYDSVCKRNIESLTRVIQTSLNIKLTYINQDEFDIGIRNMLNYGHCAGHAIESASFFRIPHGQAVILGMLIANQLAVQRGLLSEEKRIFYQNNLLLPSLKIKILHKDLSPDVILAAMRNDKKRSGHQLTVIMIKESGVLIKVNDVMSDEVVSALRSVENILGN